MSETQTLSDGTPSTLGRWRKIAAFQLGEESLMVKRLDDMIRENGADAPMVLSEGTMLLLFINSMHQQKAGATQ